MGPVVRPSWLGEVVDFYLLLFFQMVLYSSFSPTFSFFELFSLDFHFAYSVDCIPLLEPDRRNGYGVSVFFQFL